MPLDDDTTLSIMGLVATLFTSTSIFMLSVVRPGWSPLTFLFRYSEKVGFWMKRYENFVGLTEVKAAQQKVVEVSYNRLGSDAVLTFAKASDKFHSNGWQCGSCLFMFICPLWKE